MKKYLVQILYESRCCQNLKSSDFPLKLVDFSSPQQVRQVFLGFCGGLSLSHSPPLSLTHAVGTIQNVEPSRTDKFSLPRW